MFERKARDHPYRLMTEMYVYMQLVYKGMGDRLLAGKPPRFV